MSTTALGQGPGLADAYLAGFGVVHVTHAARGARRPWEVALGHQFVEGLGVSVFHGLELLDSILDIGLERAVELLSNEGKKSGPQVIKELGIDPETQTPIEIKDGRYGAYVTNGKINATLPKATHMDEITLEVAIQLIAEKKAKGPTRKKYFKRKS